MYPANVAPPKGTRDSSVFSLHMVEKRSSSPIQKQSYSHHISSNLISNKQAKRWLSLWSPQELPMTLLALQPSFLFTAALLINLCSLNSQSLTTTWHAYNQDQVKALSDTKACERYWNSSTSQSARVLGNNEGFAAGLSELRLWPGKRRSTTIVDATIDCVDRLRGL